MATHGGARPGAGRPRGSRNKRTVELEERGRQAVAAIEEALDQPFTGDALALLQTIYKDPQQALDLRVDAAKAALRFERPSLASIDMQTTSTVHVISPDPLSAEERDREWLKQHGIVINGCAVPN